MLNKKKIDTKDIAQGKYLFNLFIYLQNDIYVFIYLFIYIFYFMYLLNYFT